MAMDADSGGRFQSHFRSVPHVLSGHGTPLWLWMIAGLSVIALAVTIPALMLFRITDWYHAPNLVILMLCFLLAIGGLWGLLSYRRFCWVALAERRPLQGFPEILAHLGPQALKDHKIIAGHALWDSNDRLIDCSGFLPRYLPQLSEWRDATARQILAALLDERRLIPVPGQSRTQTIASYIRRRDQIPGLREYAMSDGHIYQAISIDLPQGQHASIFSDVTSLRQSNDGLAGENTFREAFDRAPQANLILDSQHRPLAVNQAYTSLLGGTLDDIRQKGWQGISASDDSPATPPWSPGIRRLIDARGQPIRVRITPRPLKDNSRGESSAANGQMLICIEDISAQSETAARSRLQKTIIEHLADAVIAVDHNGIVVHGNQAALALFQWSDSMLVGTPIEQLLGGPIREALTTGAKDCETEGIIWNGSTFPALVCITRPPEHDTTLPGGAILVVTDQTHRRALDLQMVHSARLATLGEMAASIAHEFNQSLHVIRLASEAVHLDLADGRLDPDRLDKRASDILCQVDRLTELVTHMRAISRREGLVTGSFSPQTAVDAALRLIEPLIKADGIQVRRCGNLNGIMAQGHQVRLEQVLLNLLNNSRDAICDRFRQQGGHQDGIITITCEAVPDSQRVTIRVRDDGTGIPPHIGEHVFEPFITTKQGGAGLGLGLSISHTICAEMGGSLSFCNVESGAEFVIDLPATTVTSGQRPLAPPADWGLAQDGKSGHEDDDPGEERRILLVDDEALSVMMVSDFLQRLGYVVDTAYDGQEAYALCCEHVYHAVITDIRMPRMSGHELITRLDELQPGTPVIVVTGHLRETNAIDLGPNVIAMLSKPFQLRDLRDHLQKIEQPLWRQKEKGE